MMHVRRVDKHSLPDRYEYWAERLQVARMAEHPVLAEEAARNATAIRTELFVSGKPKPPCDCQHCAAAYARAWQ